MFIAEVFHWVLAEIETLKGIGLFENIHCHRLSVVKASGDFGKQEGKNHFQRFVWIVILYI